MKIRVAVLEEDKNYLERMSRAFHSMYADEIEIYSFSDKQAALDALETGVFKMDFLLAGESFEIDAGRLPRNCGFAYFVDKSQVKNFRGQKAICKFQKAELIYKAILAIYADVSGMEAGISGTGEKNAAVLSFVSTNGGAGSSSVAAACAKRLAGENKSVLYINLERFGSAGDFFEAEGAFDLGDVIFAIKSNKSNLPMKLESIVKRDISGVYFFDSCKLALDVMEMKEEDIHRLLEELRALKKYDCIIMDMDFGLEKRELEVMKQSFRIVVVSDGTEIANTKLRKGIEAFSVLEQNGELKILSKCSLLYNKFRSKTGRKLPAPQMKELGGIPLMDGADTSEVVRAISERDIWDSFFT